MASGLIIGAIALLVGLGIGAEWGRRALAPPVLAAPTPACQAARARQLQAEAAAMAPATDVADGILARRRAEELLKLALADVARLC